MKLIIQIPCYNEEATLPAVLADLPREIPGVAAVETLVIDDGSTDRTVAVAHELGVDHIVRLGRNRGLATAFRAGVEACLALGADIVVNTDGDNQYCGADVPALVAPVLAREAEIVVGERPIDTTEHFSPLKKLLQRLGSWVVRRLSGTPVRDAASGFRAFSRLALERLNLLTDYSHTMELLIQAGRMRLPVAGVPIRTNRKMRESRLFHSLAGYVSYSAATILRVWLNYSALRVFLGAAALFLLGGVGLGVRFLYFFATGQGQGHVQSLILTAVLLFVGFQLVVIGLLADMVGSNRRLLESLMTEVRRLRYGRGSGSGD
ncbi:MAG: glycosyltransferase family 2 protein [bacterium]